MPLGVGACHVALSASVIVLSTLWARALEVEHVIQRYRNVRGEAAFPFAMMCPLERRTRSTWPYHARRLLFDRCARPIREAATFRSYGFASNCFRFMDAGQNAVLRSLQQR